MAQANIRPDRGQVGRMNRDKNFWKSKGANDPIATAKVREEYVSSAGYYMKQGALPLNGRGK